MSKSDKTKQFIIEQSAPIINKKGVSGTSITDLMQATKLAKGGIYGNFENKEEICLEAFRFLSGAVAKGLDAATAPSTTVKAKLFALLDYYQVQVATSEVGGCPLLNFGLEADDTNPAMRQEVAKAIKRSQHRIAKLVEEGKRNGEFRKKTDASLFALKMFTMIEGGIFTARVTGTPGTMKIIVDTLKKEIEAF
jgi:TetR/AcrR family transcriptional regulator, transcriptional repressor for nem operon